MTLTYDVPHDGDALFIDVQSEEVVVIWPADSAGEPGVLLNGASAEGLSWNFKR